MKKNKTIIFKGSTEEDDKLIQMRDKTGYAHLSEYIRHILFANTEQGLLMEVLKTLRIIEERK